jgi:heptaprenylglyceryl phosphate synthase
VWGCLVKVLVHNPKNLKIRSKTIDYVFINYVYNSNAYQFIVHKSSIKNIHPNIIMKSRNATYFEDVFPFKKT